MNDSTSLELIWNSEFPTFGVGNTKAVPCRKAEAAAPSISEVEILQVADAVCRSTSLNLVRLTDEFYPGHLSVALIDAVFNTSKRVDRRATQIQSDAARYCCQFGVARTRTVRWEMPAVARQETLGDLIRRYDAFGVDRMADDIFQMRAVWVQHETIGCAKCPGRRQGVARNWSRRSPGRAVPAFRRDRDCASASVRSRGRDRSSPADVHRRRRFRARGRDRSKFRCERARPQVRARPHGGGTRTARRVRAGSLAHGSWISCSGNTPCWGTGWQSLRSLRFRPSTSMCRSFPVSVVSSAPDWRSGTAELSDRRSVVEWTSAAGLVRPAAGEPGRAWPQSESVLRAAGRDDWRPSRNSGLHCETRRAHPSSWHRTCEQRGIVPAVEEVDPPIEVRSGGATARADLGEELTLLDPIARLHQDAGQVQERRRQTVTVVDDQRTTRKEHVWMNQSDNTGGRGENLRTGRCRDVDAVVRPPSLSGENTL